MAIGAEAVSEAISFAHEAALGDRPWSDFLHRLNGLIGGVFANLEIVDLKTGRYIELNSTENLEVNEEYLEHYYSINPRISKLLMPLRHEIVHDYQIFSDTDMDRNEFYNDFLAPHDLRYFAGVCTLHTAELFAGFSIQRAKSHGNIDEEQLTILHHLLPHLKQAVKTHLKVSQLKSQIAQSNAFREAVERPAITLDKRGKVLSINPAGDRLLLQIPALVDDGVIQLDTSLDTLLLNNALQRMAGSQKERDGTETFIIKGDQETGPLHFELVSCHHSGGRIPKENEPVALLMLRSNERTEASSDNALSRTYDLTQAELSLLKLIWQGATLRESAQIRGVQYETARGQLKSIMAKFDVNRQTDLVRLLATIRA
ncbi:MAG: hypothetical protein ABJN26_24675 [Stappiaceae bacterium]